MDAQEYYESIGVTGERDDEDEREDCAHIGPISRRKVDVEGVNAIRVVLNPDAEVRQQLDAARELILQLTTVIQRQRAEIAELTDSLGLMRG